MRQVRCDLSVNVYFTWSYSRPNCIGGIKILTHGRMSTLSIRDFSHSVTPSVGNDTNLYLNKSQCSPIDIETNLQVAALSWNLPVSERLHFFSTIFYLGEIDIQRV